MDLASIIRRLSDEAAARASNEDVREAVMKTGGVPVHTDLGGILLVAPDGQVLHYDPESGRVQAPGHNWKQLALAKAARRFPELEELRPRKPDGAAECRACEGSGVLQEGVDCGTCFGAGWLPPPT